MWLDRAHTFWLRPDGTVLARVPHGMGRLGETDWAEIGDFSSGILDSILKYKVAMKYGPQNPYGQNPYGQQPGAFIGATPQGFFGGMSSTTLILIIGAAFLFFAYPPGRR